MKTNKTKMCKKLKINILIKQIPRKKKYIAYVFNYSLVHGFLFYLAFQSQNPIYKMSSTRQFA